MSERQRHDDVREGIGCILLVIAVFLLFFLLKIVDPLTAFVGHWLESHS